MRIQDIAKEAGVSNATVSRVFSNSSSVNAETHDKVMRVARKYAYHPRLSSKRHNVVIIIPSIMEVPFQVYTEMVVSELSRELSDRGYRIEILPQDNFEQLEKIQFCGAVAIGIDSVLTENWDKRFEYPLVLVDREALEKSRGVYAVHSDEFQGMELAINYLRKRGHNRIGCLIGSIGVGNSLIRRKDIFIALEKNGLPADESLVRFTAPEQLFEEVGKLLRAEVDAMFCPGGNGGIITAYALSLFGKRIPEDISLIASERTMISRYCVPAQTTISQDYPALAAKVVDVIDARIDGKDFPRQTVFPYKLIVRDSVASCKK